MSLFGNLIWIIFGGLIGAVAWMIAGILCCITIVGIPFGIQCFKIGGLVLAPFGREIDLGRFGFSGAIGNVLWIALLGWELCLGHLVSGVLFYITIIGIPFGHQHFKLAGLALLPFGARVD